MVDVSGQGIGCRCEWLGGESATVEVNSGCGLGIGLDPQSIGYPI